MRAVILKELSENAKWALLLFVLLAGYLAYSMTPFAYFNQGLLDNHFRTATAIGFAAAGLALGILQILQDFNWGRWSFLTHRPISRTEIFFGKVIAGVILYVLAAGIPLAAAIALAASPRGLGLPFEWRMTLPVLTDFLAGIMFYAAGLLVASRSAQWIGGRVLPAGFALGGAIAAGQIAGDFTWALIVIAVVVAILLPAAAGAFARGGAFATQPVVLRMLQTVSVCAGLLLALSYAARIYDVARGQLDFSFDLYQLDAHGTVIHVVTQPQGPIQITDLQGRPATRPDRFNWLTGAPATSLSVDKAHPNGLVSGWEEPVWYLRRVETIGDVNWFYVPARKTLEAYDTQKRIYVGSIGPNGFQPAPSPAEPFPASVQADHTINSSGLRAVLYGPEIVYVVDFGVRRVQTLSAGTAEDPILDANAAAEPAYDAAPLSVLTRGAVHVYLPDGKSVQLPLETPVASVSVTRISDDGSMVLRYGSAVARFNAQGQLIDRTTLPRPERRTITNPKDRITAELLTQPTVTPLWNPITGQFMMPSMRLINLFRLAIGVSSAAIAVLLLRRRGAGAKANVSWAITNFLVGAPGVLLLLCTRDWPAKTACPHCGRCRVVDRELCEHCNAAFAAPKREGIEILELA